MARPPVLAALVLASLATGGCLSTDLGAWWDNEGVVRIHLAPVGPESSDVEMFHNLTLTVWSVGLSVASGSANDFYLEPYEYAFDPPLRVAFVEAATEGIEIPLVEARLPLRAVKEVIVRVTVNETYLTRTTPIEACYVGASGDRDPDTPCVRVARGGEYTLFEPAFTPTRGGLATYVFPLGVYHAPQSGQYVLRHDTGSIRLD